MKKIDMIAMEDWKKMGAGLNASCNAALDLYTMLANSLGKSHPNTKKALTAYNRVVCLKTDMRHLAKENASGMFEQKELDSLFPDTNTENGTYITTIRKEN